MNYADLLLSMTTPQKYAILKLRSPDDLMAYAEAEGLAFTRDQAEKMIVKIKEYRKEITDEEKNSTAYKSRFAISTPCRYCGSSNMDISVDSISIYVQCSSCKCNIIEI